MKRVFLIRTEEPALSEVERVRNTIAGGETPGKNGTPRFKLQRGDIIDNEKENK